MIEVDVQKNEAYIKDLVENAASFQEAYGKTLSEKIALYREKVRCFPNSVELKESLLGILTMLEVREGAFPDIAICREMASLTEDVIEGGGGRMGISHHQSQLVHFMERLDNAQRAATIAENSMKMEACREMLLPVSLSGRKQVDARKDLIFKCADALINTVYDLYGDNATDLTEEEWSALASCENIVATIYGKGFSDHFVLVRGMYKAVQGALKRGNIDEALQRLQVIVDRLKLKEAESAQISPLLLRDQVANLYLSALTIFDIYQDAMWLIENILKDFTFEGAPSRKKNSQFDQICRDLDRMMESDGGQWAKDAHAMLRHFVKAPAGTEEQ